jgi:methionyl-tRNA formyltransferase
MRILFFGTSPFAVPALHALLLSRHEVIGVVTQPDRPHGRGLLLSQSPIKKAVQTLAPAIPILQPERARAKEFVQAVREMQPDALVVAAFGQILPQRLLDISPHGGINVHGSLLPRWRGAAPIQFAIMEGDLETGVTTMQMDAGMDTGDILLMGRVAIGQDDNAQTLEEKLAALGADLLLETLTLLEEGNCPSTPQDGELATYAPSLPPDIGMIDWSQPAEKIASRIRGLSPRPGAFAFCNGRRIKLWRAQDTPAESEQAAGVVVKVTPMGIIVQAGKQSALLLEEVQPESKNRMPASDWARGAHLQPGAAFDHVSRYSAEPGERPQWLSKSHDSK